jgi:hypothetical protein
MVYNSIDRKTRAFDDCVGLNFGQTSNENSEKRISAETEIETLPGSSLEGPVAELVKVKPIFGLLFQRTVSVRVGMGLGEKIEFDFGQPKFGLGAFARRLKDQNNRV